MAAAAARSVAMDKPGKYPVVLSDALLRKASSEVYTGIRYNHKPDASATDINLKPSDDPTTYDLSFSDNTDQYAYTGARNTSKGQFVLIFDPEKKHFVLHRVDSTFDMNLVNAPWNADAEALRSQYPQLEPVSHGGAPQRKAAKPAKHVAAAKVTKRQKVEKPKKRPVREPTPEPEEDSDDVLTIEYPKGPSSQQYQYQSTPAFQREESEASVEDSDAEGEDDDEYNQDVDRFKLGSPANDAPVATTASDADMEALLEEELEQALAESSESEEE